MKNLRKREGICHDASYLQNHKPFKKFKHDSLSNEYQSSINWQEVKIILDASVVEKYLNNKKSVSGSVTTISMNSKRSSHQKENFVPCAPQVDEKINNVFSPDNNVMVKIEAPEEACFVDSEPKETLPFEDVMIKQEDYNFVQDTDPLSKDEFAASITDDFPYEIDEKSLFTEQTVEAVFKNDVTESVGGFEDVNIGQEFKQEVPIPNYEKSKVNKLSHKKGNQRKNTLVYHCDHCEYKISCNKGRLPNHMWSKHEWLFPGDYTCETCKNTFASMKKWIGHQINCPPQFFFKCKFCLITVTSKREMKIHLETVHVDKLFGQIERKVFHEVWFDSMKDVAATLELEGNTEKLTRFARIFLNIRKYCRPITSDQKSQKQYYKCKMCDYKNTAKYQVYEHVIFMHTNDVISNEAFKNKPYKCSKCGMEFPSNFGKIRFTKHEELCGIFINYSCKFCPVTFRGRQSLNIHLSRVHVNKLKGENIEDVLSEIGACRKMMLEVNKKRLKERLMKNPVVKNPILNSGYFINGISDILKPDCIKCHGPVSKRHGHCIKCQTVITFQCLLCDKNFENYQAAWEHVTQTCQNRIFTLPVKRNNTDSDKTSVTKSAKAVLNCNQCSYQTKFKENLSRHVRCKHNKFNGNKFTCPQCRRNFDDLGNFVTHGCRTNFFYKCHYCFWSSMSLVNVKKHIIREHDKYFRNNGILEYEAVDEIMQQIFENATVKELGARAYKTRQPVKRFAGKIGRNNLMMVQNHLLDHSYALEDQPGMQHLNDEAS